MNAASFSAIWDADARSPIAHHDSAAVGEDEAVSTIDCAETPTKPVLSDECREAAIKLAGHALEHAQALYEATGCFADAARRDSARIAMETLIAGRSDAQKARMLAEQAERMAREPGASK